ncbi:PH domain-containing protein [Paenibacillus sp. NPDC058071]|uniref:PH domain-containing protein n=1 Tax=Paenibacillus sp. NPDC058071 TaxID=3346326 RepID=UPI0036DAB19B
MATFGASSKYKEGLLFAISLPEHAIEHEQIEKIQAAFHRRSKPFYVWMPIAFIPIFLLYKFGAAQTFYFFVWTGVLIFTSAVPFRKAFRETLALKREQGWVYGMKNGRSMDEEDEYWANGFTYHNPNDKRMMVDKRVGIGQAVNTGTKAGKSLLWAPIAFSIVLILGVSIMMLRSELKPPTLLVTDNDRIEINYPMYSFGFNAADIEEIVLTENVPSGVKSNGAATNKYARGHFRLKEIGKSRLYVHKNHPPYIRIKLPDVYVFYNEQDPEQTKQWYSLIKERSEASR